MPIWSWAVFSIGILGMAAPAVLPDGIPPDPNDPLQNPDEAIEIYRKNIKDLYWLMDGKVSMLQIKEEVKDKVVLEYAQDAVKEVRRMGVHRTHMFDFGELQRTAKMWPEAEVSFQKALEFYGEKNEDKKINSLLRIAHVQAEQGKNKEAIETTKLAFAASPGNKPPILFAIYLEIAPALVKNGYTAGVADLIMEGVRQHSQAVVDPFSESGQVFLSAQAHHMNRASKFASQLYRVTGQEDKAKAAETEAAQLIQNATK